MLNKIIIQGRLCRDVELRRLPDGKAVASVAVACDRDYGKDGQRETDFIDIVAFGGTGEFLSKYFGRGSMVVISGRLQIRGWTDKDGNKRRSAEVVADQVYFGESKKEDSGVESGQYTGFVKNPAPAVPANDFQQITVDDEQLPF